MVVICSPINQDYSNQSGTDKNKMAKEDSTVINSKREASSQRILLWKNSLHSSSVSQSTLRTKLNTAAFFLPGGS